MTYFNLNAHELIYLFLRQHIFLPHEKWVKKKKCLAVFLIIISILTSAVTTVIFIIDFTVFVNFSLE